MQQPFQPQTLPPLPLGAQLEARTQAQAPSQSQPQPQLQHQVQTELHLQLQPLHGPPQPSHLQHPHVAQHPLAAAAPMRPFAGPGSHGPTTASPPSPSADQPPPSLNTHPGTHGAPASAPHSGSAPAALASPVPPAPHPPDNPIPPDAPVTTPTSPTSDPSFSSGLPAAAAASSDPDPATATPVFTPPPHWSVPQPPSTPGAPPIRTPAAVDHPRPRTMPPLREYQRELAEYAKYANAIIFCPTGSGKTLMAAHVAWHALGYQPRSTAARKGLDVPAPKNFVVFLVDRLPLVNQQAAALDHFFSDSKFRVGSWSSDHPIASWSRAFKSYDILVIIDNIFFQMLVSRDALITDVDLIICDECHHATNQHTMGRIFNMFYAEADAAARPQVLGLTASPGGGDLSPRKTYNQILKLCKTLNAHIRMVTAMVRDLEEWVTPVNAETIPIDLTPPEEALRAELLCVVKLIEQRLSDWALEGPTGLSIGRSAWQDLAALGVQKADKKYWLHCAQQHNLALTENRQGVACLFRVLRQLSEALATLQEVGTKETKDFLNETEFREAVFNRTPDCEAALRRFACECYVRLYNFLQRVTDHQPAMKLTRLLEVLRAAQQRPDADAFRAIIFTDTKKSTVLLRDVIRRELPCVRPHEFVGHAKTEGDNGRKIGQNTRVQDAILRGFRDGRYNVLVATNVAEEGLDIRECNLVIRYDTQFNPTAIIQSRGRARHRDSRFVIVLRRAQLQQYQETLKKEANMYTITKDLMDRQAQGQSYLAGSGAGPRAKGRDSTLYEHNPKQTLNNYCVENGFGKPDYHLSQTKGAGKQGAWRCSLSIPRRSGPPVEETVTGPSGKVVMKDVAAKVCRRLAEEGLLKAVRRVAGAPQSTRTTHFLGKDVVRIANNDSAAARALRTYKTAQWGGDTDPMDEVAKDKNFMDLSYDQVPGGYVAHLTMRKKLPRSSKWTEIKVSTAEAHATTTEAANTAALQYLRTEGIYFCTAAEAVQPSPR